MQGGDPTCVNAKYYMELQNFLVLKKIFRNITETKIAYVLDMKYASFECNLTCVSSICISFCMTV